MPDQPNGRRAVLVTDVVQGGPSQRGGLRRGDVVLSVNGERTETSRALVRYVAAVAPGQSVRLAVQREGRSQDLSVTVGRRPASPS